jgi:hypothetical protein
MSRSGYNEDCEYVELYRSAVRRAIRGKRGQAFLRELIAALDALSEKKLIADEFERDGEVCALGAVALARAMDMRDLNRIYDDNPQVVARRFDIAWSLAAEIMYENDEAPHLDETDEKRFVRIRHWAELNLIEWDDDSIS